MRAEDRSEEVVGVGDVGHPVAHRLVDRVLQRPAAGVDAADLGAEEAHAEHVERLPIHVFRAHIDMTLEPEQGAGGRARDPVLARAGFGDDAALAHAGGEQRLPQRVVDLVRAGVRQVFALQKDPRAARRFRQARRLVDRRRSADVVLEQAVQFCAKRRIVAHLEIRALERFDRLDERLRHVTPAEFAEIAAPVRIAPHLTTSRSSGDARARRPPSSRLRTARARAGDP